MFFFPRSGNSLEILWLVRENVGIQGKSQGIFYLMAMSIFRKYTCSVQGGKNIPSEEMVQVYLLPHCGC